MLSLKVPDAVKEKIPTQVTTVHRLLGSRPGTRHFRHHIGNPLPLDVLVVDEASMIDLEMMANLLDACHPMLAWYCWVTRTSWPRLKPGRCWGICAATPKPVSTARKPASGCNRSAAKTSAPAACRKTSTVATPWRNKW